MAEELRDRDYRALAGFRAEMRRFLRFSEEAALAVGLAPQQHQALLAIRAAPDESMLVGELADRLMLKPHTVSELIGRLESAHYVRRLSPAADRRTVCVGLTEEGRSILAELSSVHRDELRRLVPLLQELAMIIRPM